MVVGQDGVVLSGRDLEGLGAASTTLLQALEYSGDGGGGGPINCSTPPAWRLPFLVIHDFPEFSYRGMDVDCARASVPLAQLKRLVVLARYYKLNHLHLHLTDDQAFTFPSQAFPRLASKSAYSYTAAALAELQAFAAARGVTVVGESDVPGHATAIVVNDPANFGFPSSPATHIVNFVNATVVRNLQTLFDEIRARRAHKPRIFITLNGNGYCLRNLCSNRSYSFPSVCLAENQSFEGLHPSVMRAPP